MVKRKRNESKHFDQLTMQFENLELNDLKKVRVQLRNQIEDLELNDLKKKVRVVEREDPEVVNIQPWFLEQQGITLTSWCLQKNNIYVGTDMQRFLGKNMELLPKHKLYWHCTKNGSGRIEKYRKYIEHCLVSRLGMLSDKKLGCFCFKYERCHCKVLLELYRKNKHKFQNTKIRINK